MTKKRMQKEKHIGHIWNLYHPYQLKHEISHGVQGLH